MNYETGNCENCGHAFGSHYDGNYAMPCRYCDCERCEGKSAEGHRLYMARRGKPSNPDRPAPFWVYKYRIGKAKKSPME